MNKISIRNKKASFNYELLDKLVAGIVLTGTEIKSIRNGKANLNESFCAIVADELFIKGMHISPYEYGTHVNHESKADRKLLLNRKELDKWASKTKEKGLTIVPTKLYFLKGKVKVEIAVAKGKKLYDKRQVKKTKDWNREKARILSRNNK